MKRRNLLKILGIAAVVVGFPPNPAVAAEAEVAPEARMVVELVTAISSESSQVGDSIRFKVVEPLTINDCVLIKAGGELQGVVTVAQPSGRLGRAGRLGIEIKSEGMNGVELPLEIVRPSADGAKGKLGVVRRIAAPLAKVGRAVLAFGGRDTVPGQAAHLAAVDPELARDLATKSTGAADPLAEVELASDSKGARVAKRGVKAVARIGGGYLNTILNGPAGALRRGGTIEVAAGARVLVAMK
jgi:hypothetical protein